MTDPRLARPYRGLFVGLVLGLSAAVGLAVYGDARELAEKLTDYRAGWFVLGLALATTNYAVRFLRWQMYLKRIGAVVPAVASARIFVAGFSMGISPGKLGEVVKSALLAEAHDVPVERSAPIVLAERLTDLVALVLLVAASSLVIDDARAIAGPAFLGVSALVLAFAVPQFGRAVLDLLARIRFAKRILPKLRAAHDSLVAMLAPGPLLAASLLATLGWFLECVALWAIARGFPNLSLSLAEATFAYSAPTILGALAMLPGGLLVTEASMTGILRSLGTVTVSEAVASGVTLLIRLATLWWAVVLGLVALAWQRRVIEGSSATIRGTNEPVGRPEGCPVPATRP